MAKGKIYLIGDDSELLPMEEAAYDSERLLQELLAKHPDLLAGDQINTDEPRRWLLVRREMPVPGHEAGGGRWSIDHLFLDQEAVPTLVEVKRSSDTRIRREVVGQLLDYAANAVAYWPVEEIQSKFERQCEEGGSDPQEELDQFLETDDADDFWQQVKTNLQAGRIRLIFIADTIPTELRRVVEFLNKQMDPAEVLAIEVRQFAGKGMKTLVPRVIGQDESARQKKGTRASTGEAISVEDFLEVFHAQRPPAEQKIARRLMDWAGSKGLQSTATGGRRGASFFPVVTRDGRELSPLSLKSWGLAVIQMLWLKNHPPFDAPEKREELHTKLRRFPGLRIRGAGMEGLPAVRTESLADDATLEEFVGVLDWILEELRRA